MKIINEDVELNVECSGKEDGPVVIMAHSLGCDLRMWDPQLPVLEPHYRVIRLDMRGHGQSTIAENSCTLEQLADDVIAVMDGIGIDKAHWVGLSIGGMIGQSLLLRYPDRFLSAVLSDTSSAQPPAAAPIWDERIKAVQNDGLGSIVDATMERWFTANYLADGGEALDAVRAQLATTSDVGYIACCRAIAKLNYIDRLSEIGVPVCVIVGAQDVATPIASSEQMHERLPNSELHILENASHIANVEQANEFNALLMRFLSSVNA